MQYLYGDSTPSPLRTNFIELLRDAIDFAVHAATAAERLEEGAESQEARRQAADVELDRLTALEGVVQKAVASAPTGASDSPTARCASSIGRSAADLVKAESEAVRARLLSDCARIDGEAAQLRDGCHRAFETLLKRHDLPDATTVLSLRLDGGRYRAQLHGATPYGIETTLGLEAPAAHALAHPLRIDRLIERLEVQAPETSGWLQKKIKLKAQRLEKHFLAGMSSRGGVTTITLRTNAEGAADGYDVQVESEPARARLVRLGEQGEALGDPFDVQEADVGRLVELRDKILETARDLTQFRGALGDARFDGTPLREVGEPQQVVERLIAVIAPTVREISSHALSRTELVLKRLLGDDRREEIFVSKAELAKKIEGAPESKRALFDPLGLGDAPEAAAPSPTPSRPPSPPVRAATAAAPKAVVAEISAPGIPIDESSIVVENDSGVVVAIEAEASPRPARR